MRVRVTVTVGVRVRVTSSSTSSSWSGSVGQRCTRTEEGRYGAILGAIITWAECVAGWLDRWRAGWLGWQAGQLGLQAGEMGAVIT